MRDRIDSFIAGAKDIFNEFLLPYIIMLIVIWLIDQAIT